MAVGRVEKYKREEDRRGDGDGGEGAGGWQIEFLAGSDVWEVGEGRIAR